MGLPETNLAIDVTSAPATLSPAPAPPLLHVAYSLSAELWYRPTQPAGALLATFPGSTLLRVESSAESASAEGNNTERHTSADMLPSGE